MLCKEVEQAINNKEISIEVQGHIDQCESCKLYYSLHETHPISPKIDDLDLKIDAIVREADHIKKRHDVFSLIVFIVLMLTVFSIVITMFEPKILIFIQVAGTTITPIVLLVWLYLKERNIIHVR